MNRIDIPGIVGIKNTLPNLTLDVGSTNGNHNIGSAILTVGIIHNADKLDSLSIGRWDRSTTTDWQFSLIRYNVTTGGQLVKVLAIILIWNFIHGVTVYGILKRL